MIFITQITIDGILTAIAALLSPLIAIIISQYLQKLAFVKQRQLQIFRTLMQHRYSGMTQEFVDALNLVEAEFSRETGVIEARKKLQEAFVSPNYNVNNIHLAQSLLISEISKVLKIDVSQIDILYGSYSPAGWVNEDKKRRELQDAIMEIAQGKKFIKIKSIDNYKDEDKKEENHSHLTGTEEI